MTKTLQCDVNSKRFALRIATMIDSRLIWYKHYYGWADQLIATLDAPPQWILEIATIKYYPDAVAAVNRFVYAEPFERFDGEQCDDEYIACLYLRSESGAISWATFLNDAGAYTDAGGGPVNASVRRDNLWIAQFAKHRWKRGKFSSENPSRTCSRSALGQPS